MFVHTFIWQLKRVINNNSYCDALKARDFSKKSLVNTTTTVIKIIYILL
jgi:hypothetical protein